MTYTAINPSDLTPIDPAPAVVSRKRRLGEMLIDAGLITAEQLTQALAHQAVHGGRLGSALVTLGMLSEADLESNLGRQLGITVCDVESVNPPADLLKLVREQLIRKYEVIPLGRKGKTLVLGMTNPLNLTAIDDILFRTGMRNVEPRLITETTFQRFVSTRYTSAAFLDRISNEGDLEAALLDPGRTGLAVVDDDESRRVRDADPDAGAPVVVRLTSYLLRQAVLQRASDIHIEPYDSFSRVRFRVDGNLHTELTPPLHLHAPLISRIKLLAGLDIGERRKPQDGHLKAPVDDEDVQFRVSTLPTIFGEKAVIRLVRHDPALADILQLGLRPEQVKLVRKAARSTQGLVLVTGPTGSGKTTTVHAMLNLVNDADMNIVSLEDPVERPIPGVNHVQIHEKTGLSFTTALKSILRQDPDVVFVGEMREPEVANAAVRGALTGHLVISTLHTSGVIETFTRMLDLGVEPHMLASAVQMVIGQTLLRRLCACADTRPIPRSTEEEFGLTPTQVATAHHRVPIGCPHCLNTGYRGRLGVFEVVAPGAELREQIRKGAGEDAMRDACTLSGVRWVWDAAVAAVLAGETSFEEVRRTLRRHE